METPTKPLSPNRSPHKTPTNKDDRHTTFGFIQRNLTKISSLNRGDGGSTPPQAEDNGKSRPLASFALIRKTFNNDKLKLRHTTMSGVASSVMETEEANRQTTRYMDRPELKAYLRAHHEDASTTNNVIRLGNLCYNELQCHGLETRTPEMFYHAACLLEWANHRDGELSFEDYRKLAHAHYHAWLTSGIVGEAQHLTYAKAAYETALQNSEVAEDPETWLEYSKVLMHLGESELGVKTITSMLRRFQGKQETTALYHLTAGAMLISLGNYDQAGHYFFETIQLGLPKFFTKSDLLFVLSRSFEQLGNETRLDTSDPVEDGYIMVFTHMLTETKTYEQFISAGGNKDEVYERWLSNFETWRDIGDKCAMHGLFSLAADFYGQGLVRDRTAFMRSSLWFRFAKACFRCGRTSDAQLAVKQAITLDPDNLQCQLAFQSWSIMSNNLVNLVAGPLQPLLDLLPTKKTLVYFATLKIQALYLGECARAVFRSPITLPERSDFLKQLTCQVDLLVCGIKPIMVEVAAYFNGYVKSVYYTEIGAENESETKTLLRLEYPFRLPLHRVKPECTYALTIVDAFLSPTDGSSLNGHHFYISYVENETGIYYRRQLCFTLDDETRTNLSLEEPSGTVETNAPSEERVPSPRPAHMIPLPDLVCDDSTAAGTVTTGTGTMTNTTTISVTVSQTKLETADQQSSVASTHEGTQSDHGRSKEDQENDDNTASVTHASVFPQDSISAMSQADWPEEGSIEGSLYSLFGPFRPRKGTYRYYGTNYLYNARVQTRPTPTATADVVPSARAMKQDPGNPITMKPAQTEGTIHIQLLNVHTENQFLFILPLRLAALEHMADLLPLLLLTVYELSAEDLTACRIASQTTDTLVTNLEELLTSMTPRRHGVPIYGGKMELLVQVSAGTCGEVIITINESQRWAQHHPTNVKQVLSTQFNKLDAWDFLQDQVMQAFEWEAEGSMVNDLEKSLAESRASNSKYSCSKTSMTMTPSVDLEQQSSVLNGEDDSVSETFVNDLERSLYEKHKLNLEADSDCDVSVLTFTDEARVKAEEAARVKAEEAARVTAAKEEERARERAMVKSAADAKDEAIEKAARLEREAEAAKRKLLEDEIERVREEERIQEEKEEEERQRIAKEAAEEALRLKAELEKLSKMPEIHTFDLLNVDTLIEGDADAQTFRSFAFDEEVDAAKRAMEKAEDMINIQAAFFLAFQVQLLEALEFLKDAGDKAKHREVRLEAFGFLQKRTAEAVANPVPNKIRQPEIFLSKLEPDAPIPLLSPAIERTLDPSQSTAMTPPNSSPKPLSITLSRAHSVSVIGSSSLKGQPRSIPKSKTSSLSPAKNQNQNQRHRSIIGSEVEREVYRFSRKKSVIPVPTTMEEEKERIWRSQKKKQLDDLLENYLIDDDKDGLADDKQPNNLIRVLHEFDTPRGNQVDVSLASVEENKESIGAGEWVGESSISTSGRSLPMKRSTILSRDEQSSLISSAAIVPSVIISIPEEKMHALESALMDLSQRNKLNFTGKGHQNPLFFLENAAIKANTGNNNYNHDQKTNRNTMMNMHHGDSTSIKNKDEPEDSVLGTNFMSIPQMATEECEYKPEAIPLESMFDNSIGRYVRSGYSTGTCAYLAIWKMKLRHCVRSYATPRSLMRAIRSLQRAYGEPVGEEGALCALAVAKGILGEALGELRDHTFRQEVILVCCALPVHTVIDRLQAAITQDSIGAVTGFGGPAAFDATGMTQYASSTFDDNDKSKSVADINDALPLMMTPQPKAATCNGNNDVTQPIMTSTRERRERDGFVTQKRSMILTGPFTNSHTSNLFHEESTYIEEAGDFPTAASRNLPHHGLDAYDESVRSRAKYYRVPQPSRPSRERDPQRNYLDSLSSYCQDTNPFDSVYALPALQHDSCATTSKLLKPLHRGSAASGNSMRNRSGNNHTKSITVPIPSKRQSQDQVQSQWKQRPTKGKGKPNGKINGKGSASVVPGKRSSFPGNGHGPNPTPAPGTVTIGQKPPKFTRLSSTIDQLSEATGSFAVLTKIEADRAREENIVSKYHPQTTSYYRSAKQSQILSHRKKKESRVFGEPEPSYEDMFC